MLKLAYLLGDDKIVLSNLLTELYYLLVGLFQQAFQRLDQRALIHDLHLSLRCDFSVLVQTF